MSFELFHLLLIGLLYLALLFGIALPRCRWPHPRRWMSHPPPMSCPWGICQCLVTLRLRRARPMNTGLVFRLYYLGLSGAFVLAPVLLIPILRITEPSNSPPSRIYLAFPVPESDRGLGVCTGQLIVWLLTVCS